MFSHSPFIIAAVDTIRVKGYFSGLATQQKKAAKADGEPNTAKAGKSKIQTTKAAESENVVDEVDLEEEDEEPDEEELEEDDPVEIRLLAIQQMLR